MDRHRCNWAGTAHWKSGLEQLGAEGDLELLRLVADQRQRQESGDQINQLTREQIGLIEGLTGIKGEHDTADRMEAPADH